MKKKIPNYILKAVEDRAKAADKFNELDIMISKWCDANCGIDAVEDTWGYVDTLSNPYEAAERTIKDIKNNLTSKEEVNHYDSN